MFLYDFPLNVIQLILLFRIAKRRHRMMKTVQTLPLGQVILIVPIVEKIIVQQRAPDQIVLVAANPQLFI